MSESLEINSVKPRTNVQGGVMENYSVTACDQLPANGRVAFNPIHVYGSDYSLITPAFFTEVRENQCSNAVATSNFATTITWTP